MSRRISNILVGALLVALAGTIPASAEAGYVKITDSASSLLMSNPSTGAGTADKGASKRIDREPDEFSVAGQSQGASAPSTPSPTTAGGGLAILPPSVISAQAQLVQWLGPAGKLWLPPPFSSGIFRPPRRA